MKEKCLQEKIGSCKGCNVYQIVREKVAGNLGVVNAVSQRVQSEYCPEGNTMQPIELPKRKIW